MGERLSHAQRGAALIIVLAFVVLLTGLVVAYFSRTVTDRQIAHSSFNQSRADQIAASAIAVITGDLRQEVVNGSASPGPTFGSGTTLSTLYTPTTNANILPMRSGNPAPVGGVDPIPNLVRRSVRNDPIITPPGIGSRASAVNSMSDPSANGRSISLARWNKHYLVLKANNLDDLTDPVASFVAPDWVMLAAEYGADVLSTPTRDSGGNTVTPVGRYAYAIYDEGGLLDMNVAGYPTGATTAQVGRKGSLAFSDLTALPFPIPNPNSDTPPVYKLDKLIGWRNYATTQPTNNFPDSSPPAKVFAKNFQTDPSPAARYYQSVVSNTNGFLSLDTSLFNERTDQAFVSRQELIDFAKSAGGFTVNALRYLTNFSREAEANSPQWSR